MTDIRNIADVISLHDTIVAKHGGLSGTRDEKLLASALTRPFTGLSDGTEYFPSMEAKASVLLHSLIQYHPFVDGNKRTGVAITQIFLLESGFHWDFGQQEIVDFVISIADSKTTREEIEQWIGTRMRART